MRLTGKFVKAKKAKSMGIVDLLVEPLGPGVDKPEVNTLNYLEQVAIGVVKYVLILSIILFEIYS